MRLAQVVDGVVVNVALVEPGAIPDFMADWVEVETAGPGWRLEDGQIVPPKDAEAESPEAFKTALVAGIDAQVESVARSRGYNSAAALASYVASTVPAWAAEAQTFVAWRDQVWLTAFAMQSNPPATVEEAIATLPVIEWPEQAA